MQHPETLSWRAKTSIEKKKKKRSSRDRSSTQRRRYSPNDSLFVLIPCTRYRFRHREILITKPWFSRYFCCVTLISLCNRVRQTRGHNNPFKFILFWRENAVCSFDQLPAVCASTSFLTLSIFLPWTATLTPREIGNRPTMWNSACTECPGRDIEKKCWNELVNKIKMSHRTFLNRYEMNWINP